MSSIKTKGRLRTLEGATRLATARAFAGKRVRVVRKYLIEPETLVGTCVTAALMLGGSVDGVLVMEVESTTQRHPRGDAVRYRYRNDGIVAISLAQIDSIEEIP